MSAIFEKVPPSPRLAIEHEGHGEAVVFLHGIGGNRRNWATQLPVFAGHFHAIACDARGYGDSDDYEGPLTFEDYASDVCRILDHLGHRKAHVVGLSMGGRIAMDFATRYADRLATLTLCDTHLGMADATPERRQIFLDLRQRPLLSGLEPKDIAPNVARSLAGPDISDEAFAALVDSLSRLHKESYLKSIEASVMRDRVTGLEGIKAPTHVVVGSADTLTPPETSRAIAAAIPGAELTIIEGAGHLSNIEEPEVFNKAVIEFILRARPL